LVVFTSTDSFLRAPEDNSRSAVRCENLSSPEPQAHLETMMDTGRVPDAKRSPGRPAGGAGACDGIFAAIVIAMLFALAFWVSATLPHALDLPQAVDIEARARNGSVAFCVYPDGCEDQPYPREIREEQPEPPLAQSSAVTSRGSRVAGHFAASFSVQS
jgi:hypothetical protein